jgi:hypothetical protein
MTNSKRFALEYDIESVGPGGVADVELWGTNDRGLTWTRWGTDADRKSPYEVDVPVEGIYGFRIVIVSKSGLASPAPQSGDVADLWVGVDVTPPQAELTSVSYGEGAFAGQLDIRWEAHDQGFGARPISLQFSDKCEGPWTTIASGLPNSGQYYWNVDSRVPKKVFIRLEVRDEAGNVTHHKPTQTISLEGLTPGARIKGFHSSKNLLPNATRR